MKQNQLMRKKKQIKKLGKKEVWKNTATQIRHPLAVQTFQSQSQSQLYCQKPYIQIIHRNLILQCSHGPQCYRP